MGHQADSLSNHYESVEYLDATERLDAGPTYSRLAAGLYDPTDSLDPMLEPCDSPSSLHRLLLESSASLRAGTSEPKRTDFLKFPVDMAKYFDGGESVEHDLTVARKPLCLYVDNAESTGKVAYGSERIPGKSRNQNHSKTSEWKVFLGKAE